MDILLLTLTASAAALIGGYTAIRAKGKLSLAMGFSAGIILGLVAFDLLPEIAKISNQQKLDFMLPMIALVVGFLSFHTAEKAILIHSAYEEDFGPHRHPYVGIAAGTALSLHSFLDGVSIGVAFQVSTAVGVAVAIAVIGHRFADGFSTTNLMIVHGNKTSWTNRMLYIAATMPVLGGLSTLFFDLSEKTLAIYLGFFAGFLLYIGASEILPQAHSKFSSRLTILVTLLGTTFMYLIVRLAS